MGKGACCIMTSSVPTTQCGRRECTDLCKLSSDLYMFAVVHIYLHASDKYFKKKGKCANYITKWLWIKLAESFIPFFFLLLGSRDSWLPYTNFFFEDSK